MILSVHIILGAAIALNINPLFGGLLLAFLSHYLLDALPHWEYSIKNIKEKNWRSSLVDFLKISLDIFFGFLIVYFLSKNFILASLGALFAVLPDIFIFLNIILPNRILGSLCNFHQKIHISNHKEPFFLRIFSELLVVSFAFYLLLR